MTRTGTAQAALRLGLVIGAIAVAGLVLEGGARVLSLVRDGEAFPTGIRTRLLAADDPEAPEDDRPYYMHEQVLHPYTGYVYDHSKQPEQTNRFGFPGADPLGEASDEDLVVALFGGSVTEELHARSSETLVRELERVAGGRRVRLVGLGLGGFKQPQQLLALTWFLSLGARFDVVVNLDGFNEIALPYTDNVRYDVYPFFPRFWALYAGTALDPRRIRILAAVQELRARRASWRAWLDHGILRHSAFAVHVLGIIDDRIALQLAKRDDRLRRAIAASRHQTYQSAGPFREYPDEDALFDDLVRVWRSASEQMARLCAANGIPYVHLLQPNQWIEGAKPLSAEEAAWWHANRDETYPNAVRQGYPRLIEAGRALRATGVAFHDLTRLFENEERTVFFDECCHFNQRGNDLLAEAVARAVAAALAAPAVSSDPG